jgi:serine protease AprX
MLTVLLALVGSLSPTSVSPGTPSASYQPRLVNGRVVSTQGVRGERVLEFPGSSTRVALWGGRNYAIALDGSHVDKEAEGDFEILLKYAKFDPMVAVPTVPRELSARTTNQVYIVQFQTQVIGEYLDALKDAGAKLSYYLANNAYIVEMDNTSHQAIAAMPFVRWVGPYQPAYRLDTDLRVALEAGKVGRQRYNIQTYHYGPAQKNQLVNRIVSIGGTIDQNVPEGYTVQASLTPQQLLEVASLNQVFYIDVWGAMEPDMDIARQISGANYIETLGNYRGQGVRGQVRDGGVRASHQAFTTGMPLVVRANTSDTSHGSSTTGIVFGNGASNINGRGMLPEAQGIFISGLATGAARYNETLALLSAPYFAVFESNSTGSPLTTAYGTESFTMDDILFRMNILICQSQSNAGSQQSRPQAWAKNIISVGGIRHLNTLTKADDNWTNGGSIGPAQDGRIKPDLSHFYDNVLCTTNTSDTAYTSSFGGTSAATPITCGHFGLLFQTWADGVYGNTVLANSVFDARPWNSTARALMINTASQYPFSGTNSDLTRTHQGWGLADVKNLYDARNNLFIVDETDRLTNLQATTYRVFVPAGQPAFRATMVYTDPPGTTSSTQHRINDLTLKVTAPDSTVYYGNNGLLAGNWSTSGGSPNTIDPIENVFVQNPASGVWTIEISAPQINADAELSTNPIDADYALVVSGVISAVGPNSFTTDLGTVIGGDNSSLQTSNNKRLNLSRTGVAAGPTIEVVGTAPTEVLQTLRFRIESRAVTQTGGADLYLYDYVAGHYTLINSGVVGLTDGVLDAAINSNASDFVNAATREIKAKIIFTSGSRAARAWFVDIDQCRWFFGV